MTCTTHQLSKYVKKMGGHRPSWRVKSDLKLAVFWHSCTVYPHWRTRGILNLTGPYDVILSRIDLKLGRNIPWHFGHPIRVKKLKISIAYELCVRICARAYASVRFFQFFKKCSKWSETCAKKIWARFKHTNISTRAYAHVLRENMNFENMSRMRIIWNICDVNFIEKFHSINEIWLRMCFHIMTS